VSTRLQRHRQDCLGSTTGREIRCGSRREALQASWYWRLWSAQRVRLGASQTDQHRCRLRQTRTAGLPSIASLLSALACAGRRTGRQAVDINRGLSNGCVDRSGKVGGSALQR